MLPVPSGLRPWMLLNILLYTGQPLQNKAIANSAKMEKLCMRSTQRKPVLERLKKKSERMQRPRPLRTLKIMVRALDLTLQQL